MAHMSSLQIKRKLKNEIVRIKQRFVSGLACPITTALFFDKIWIPKHKDILISTYGLVAVFSDTVSYAWSEKSAGCHTSASIK